MNSLRCLLIAAAIAAASLPSPALAQHSYEQSEVTSRDFQNRVLAVGADVKAQYRDAWRNAHNGSEPSGSEFVRRWALQLRAQGYTVCVNGKRGSDTLSQDVLSFPVTSGGAQDTSGPGRRIVIADVIVGAGGGNPSLGFDDVSEFAPGKCIEPKLDASESGGTTPAPGTGPGQPATPAPGDNGPILAALVRIETRLATLEARPYPPDLTLFDTFVDDMVGQGPGGDPNVTPNHVTDLKERLDKIRLLLEQLTAWLRSRRALSF